MATPSRERTRRIIDSSESDESLSGAQPESEHTAHSRSTGPDVILLATILARSQSIDPSPVDMSLPHTDSGSSVATRNSVSDPAKVLMRPSADEESSKRRDEKMDDGDPRSEFEGESTKLRADFREALLNEKMRCDSVYGEGADEGENGSKPVSHVTNGVQPTSRPGTEPEAVPPKEKPPLELTIAEVILAEAHTRKRKLFTKGDAAVITDTNDLSKTLLLSHKLLSDAAPHLCDIHIVGEHAPIKVILLLEPAPDKGNSTMPTLSAIDPRLTPSELVERYHTFHQQFQAAANVARPRVNIKNEDSDEENETAPDALPVDWVGAYETTLAIINKLSLPHIFRMLSKEKIPLLPQVEGVIAIAKRYNLLDSLSNALASLLLKFIEHHTLWKAVADNPAAWLLIGVNTKSILVYDEAFKHLCGSYPACEEKMRLAKIPRDVWTKIEGKSRELRFLRMSVDQELLTLDLRPEERSKKNKASRHTTLDDEISKNKHYTVAYQTRAIFRDFICDHMRLLEPDADGAASKLALAGFYRTIRNGGDNYLVPDEVVAEWYDEVVPFDEAKVRDMLRRLKKKAAEIVTPLTESTLQYEQKENLEYLTCVKIEDGDVPWKKDEDDEMEDD